MNCTSIAVVGGDRRQIYLANALAEHGYAVHTLLLDGDCGLAPQIAQETSPAQVLSACTVVILPLPCSKDSIHIDAPMSGKTLTIQEVLSSMASGSLLLGGRLSADVFTQGKEKGIAVADYFQREELAVLNAVPTAEGAAQILLEELPITLFGSHGVITGYGRVAKVTAHLLQAMGSQVTVCARNVAERAWAQVDRCPAVPLEQLGQVAAQADYLINTVPVPILTREILQQLRLDVPVVDLASKPGGVDWEAAGEMGLPVHWALALPGKVAPKTAGEILYQTIQNIFQEKGEY